MINSSAIPGMPNTASIDMFFLSFGQPNILSNTVLQLIFKSTVFGSKYRCEELLNFLKKAKLRTIVSVTNFHATRSHSIVQRCSMYSGPDASEDISEFAAQQS
jgi:hypothetical protein